MIPRRSRRPLAAALAAAAAAGAAVLAISAAAGAADPPAPVLGPATSPSATAQPAVAEAAAPDLTPPVIVATVTGPAGQAGWYVGDVSVRWSVTDPDSTVTDVEGCGPTVVADDVAELILACAASSDGGRTSETTVVHRDATAPVITCPTGASFVHGAPGAMLTASVTDAGSGPAAPVLTAPVDTAAVGPASIAVTASDTAGNSAQASCAIDIVPDTSAPVIGEPTIDGVLGRGGWYVGDVTVSFPVAEPDSTLLALDGCGPVVVSADTAGQVIACTATSNGGAATATTTIARDASGPAIACPSVPSIVQGSTRTLSATVTDATSGPAVASVSGALPSLTLGPASIVLAAQDNAGNGTSVECGYVVVEDPTPPVVTSTVDGPAGRAPEGGVAQAADGTIWYVGPVTVSFDVTEDESALIDETGCGRTVVAADTAGEVVTCTATSYGGARPQSVIVAVDATPPVISCDRTPVFVQGSEGEVSASFSDATSGPAATGSTLAVDTLTLGLRSTAITAFDNAGNEATQNCRYRVIEDVSRPIVAVTIDGASTAPGWYTGAVTVRFAVSDPDSPVEVLGCDPVTIDADMVSELVASCRATSYGGVSLEQVRISRDGTPPVLTCLPLRFVEGMAGRATATVADATSGPAQSSVSRPADTSTPGTREVTLTGADRAGNTASIQCSYEVAEREAVQASKLSSTGSDLRPLMVGGILVGLAGLLLGIMARRRAGGARG